MRLQRLVITLTVVNLGLLVFLLAQIGPVQARAASGVLRGRQLEIVDDRGRVRASIRLHPAERTARASGGSGYPETVILRLIDAEGRPTVKLGGSAQGAGLGLLGETDTTHALLEAEGAHTLLKLTDKDGRQRLIKP